MNLVAPGLRQAFAFALMGVVKDVMVRRVALALLLLVLLKSAAAEAQPQHLNALRFLTNPPAYAKVVFTVKSGPILGAYVVEWQKDFWKVQHAFTLDQLIRQKSLKMAGEGPLGAWVKIGKHKRRLNPGGGFQQSLLSEHARLKKGILLAERVLALGVPYGSPGTFKKSEDAFTFTPQLPSADRLRGEAKLLKDECGSFCGFEVSYEELAASESENQTLPTQQTRCIYSAAHFNGEFPHKIERRIKGSQEVLDKFEIHSIEVRERIKAPGEFELDAAATVAF